jgi:hypothetical protein
MPFNEPQKAGSLVKFEQPRHARVMAIDGTWSRECLLLGVSETTAQIKLIGPVAGLTEFFLVLASFGNPVYRRCTMLSVDGPQLEVLFKRGPIGKKTLEEELRGEGRLI